jgi:hypothetical protein
LLLTWQESVSSRNASFGEGSKIDTVRVQNLREIQADHKENINPLLYYLNSMYPDIRPVDLNALHTL